MYENVSAYDERKRGSADLAIKYVRVPEPGSILREFRLFNCCA
jgi:hypothetical protein